MTVGRREETCKEPREEGSEGDMKRPLSITALSTIAVQSGQTQIVVSVLKSGSSVHLQLVHVEPGLCEIGSNQEDNQTLIHEQKQLLGKLQKHEGEVLSSVQKKREEQRRQKQDIWTCGERRTQEEEEKEEGVYRAMENSLREGWVLLLRLLDKRLHALTLAADFYHTVHEVNGELLSHFTGGIDIILLR
ncbi:coiled-coil domain-containing protein 141-like [Boleophthalmus pectinirostris]|uniref:coiled-coil domain-containing protein 141-like n=1 Tax=Boleophthalmus pectinirostris TaxID=150288 RepID=UPI00242B6BD0|nr:coiled-coil domain-containing protein 141-like [Boleophthalmus pectinirostris]